MGKKPEDLSAEALFYKVQWEGGMGEMLTYCSDIDNYQVSEELKKRFKAAVVAFDALMEQYNKETEGL